MAMMMMFGLLICSSILLLYVETAAIASTETAANSFFHSVDPEKRNSLVSHYLTEALERINVRVYPDPRVDDPISEFGFPPTNFTENLLSWARIETHLSYIQIAAKIAEGYVNTDEDSCRYPPDIPPANFSANLLSWTRTQTNLSYIQIAASVAAGDVNSDGNSCRYPPDITCQCCPF
ncbi:hypothetical protein PVAND_007706 [Polypedilum vanderplanki]|uniref:Uncharacterized protein n=1 Tax=Polypedilum vanderplanki TaxID=319348 RepID=A0A9J6C880_POLVA|nr:hypothetical protein PVAND_007706 [Polypedilum vanderplanki]